MAAYGGKGDNRLLYGVILRDKIKTANMDTLLAYRTVAHDLLSDNKGGHDEDLRAALVDLETALKAKQTKS